jgi:hypothetical protein
VNQTYSGRAHYLSNVEGPTGELIVAVECRLGSRTAEVIALVDTASQWCILPPALAFALGYTPDPEGDTRLHTRFGLLAGELVRLPIVFVADEGEPAAVEATGFLSPDWPGPAVIGWSGCLERMRFAFDPQENYLYFAEY